MSSAVDILHESDKESCNVWSCLSVFSHLSPRLPTYRLPHVLIRPTRLLWVLLPDTVQQRGNQPTKKHDRKVTALSFSSGLLRSLWSRKRFWRSCASSPPSRLLHRHHRHPRRHPRLHRCHRPCRLQRPLPVSRSPMPRARIRRHRRRRRAVGRVTGCPCRCFRGECPCRLWSTWRL